MTFWADIQNLAPAIGAPPPGVRPGKRRQAQAAPIKPKGATTRDGSKKTGVLTLLRREGGATLQELMSATGWQAHTVRGFLSGTVGKKMGLTIESIRCEDGARLYSIASA